uniref:tRNA/rRNA methyltransferase SpoU type domain-containing protein n=1 Tax=Chromera velia CCMP2878 TaxID=1169474 RepID=A0A0G4F2I2_9ALVE|eukprot:Cvel_14723.t1-p1 / transcript=Cvel_14723.t1 / gene=Cvel_14723 / organism=Chromera_velia_CCMP2878 / gene_product=hypothetical protein / transcript_product=hypothetical protein / location=Cvel_scaffold1058:35270-42017(+) / protein_length=993 / sequence_SO=supercontig / SO=protein_coding / is_pseudo=false
MKQAKPRKASTFIHDGMLSTLANGRSGVFVSIVPPEAQETLSCCLQHAENVAVSCGGAVSSNEGDTCKAGETSAENWTAGCDRRKMFSLFITPTRPHAFTLNDSAATVPLSTLLLVGANKGTAKKQQEALQSALINPPDAVIGTPGRLAQCIREGLLSLDRCAFVVFANAELLLSKPANLEHLRTILESTKDGQIAVLIDERVEGEVDVEEGKEMAQMGQREEEEGGLKEGGYGLLGGKGGNVAGRPGGRWGPLVEELMGAVAGGMEKDVGRLRSLLIDIAQAPEMFLPLSRDPHSFSSLVAQFVPPQLQSSFVPPDPEGTEGTEAAEDKSFVSFERAEGGSVEVSWVGWERGEQVNGAEEKEKGGERVLSAKEEGGEAEASCSSNQKRKAGLQITLATDSQIIRWLREQKDREDVEEKRKFMQRREREGNDSIEAEKSEEEQSKKRSHSHFPTAELKDIEDPQGPSSSASSFTFALRPQRRNETGEAQASWLGDSATREETKSLYESFIGKDEKETEESIASGQERSRRGSARTERTDPQAEEFRERSPMKERLFDHAVHWDIPNFFPHFLDRLRLLRRPCSDSNRMEDRAASPEPAELISSSGGKSLHRLQRGINSFDEAATKSGREGEGPKEERGVCVETSGSAATATALSVCFIDLRRLTYSHEIERLLQKCDREVPPWLASSPASAPASASLRSKDRADAVGLRGQRDASSVCASSSSRRTITAIGGQSETEMGGLVPRGVVNEENSQRGGGGAVQSESPPRPAVSVSEGGGLLSSEEFSSAAAGAAGALTGHGRTRGEWLWKGGETALKGEPSLVAVLENPSSPVNVGTVMRNVDALGVGALLVVGAPEGVMDLRALLGLSASAVRWVPVGTFENCEDCVRVLREREYVSVATSPHVKGRVNVALEDKKAETIFGVDAIPRLAVWFGNEQKGLSAESISASSFCLQIEMRGHVESLNLAVCSGIVLWRLAAIRYGNVTCAGDRGRLK